MLLACLSYLLLHSLDLVLPWFHLSPQLLDLVVKDKLELFELLILLLQVINPLLLRSKMSRQVTNIEM